jgi:hypothetical protein
MTAKDKAQELVNKYLLATPVGFHIDDAKKCAIIAVDEVMNNTKNIINVLDLNSRYNNCCWGEVKEEINNWYWEEVKEEINKL